MALWRKSLALKNSFLVVRNLSTTSQITTEKLNHKTRFEWNKVLSDAEKLVEYQTSYLGLRYLLSEEFTNLALHLRKLIGSSHPIVDTAKFLFNGQNNLQTWGLIVLLISKTAGIENCAHEPELEQDKCNGVLVTQRKLAEVVEMIRTANLIHQGVFNLQHLQNCGNDLSSDSDLILGNKIALLGGDYLLGCACGQIGSLKHQELNELMSTAFRDIAESNFIGERDIQNNALPSNPKNRMKEKRVQTISSDLIDNKQPLSLKDAMESPESEWTLRNTLANGTLLGKSCQSALLLAKHSVERQRYAYFFGKHLALAMQAIIDLFPYKSNFMFNQKLSLISAPVLFQLDYDPTLFDEIRKGYDSVDNIDYRKIHESIMNGPGISMTKKLQVKHSMLALKELEKFEKSDARNALENIILALQDI